MKMKSILIIALLFIALGYGIYDTSIRTSEGDEYGNRERQVKTVSNESGNDQPQQMGVEIGNVAPDFTLLNTKKDSVALSDYRGKNVILNFWASWCPPCKAEMPDMEEFYQKNQERLNVEIIAVNLTEMDQLKEVSAFIEDYGLSFPILLDKEINVAEQYMVTTIPTSYIIDTNGVIQQKVIGPMSYDWMVEQIKQIQ